MQGLPATLDRPEPQTERPELRTGRLRAAIHYARRALLRLQRADGHWVGELQGDTILESEFILLLAFLGRESDDRRSPLRELHSARSSSQSGGWSNYAGGPPDVSVSVKAYLALKIAGHTGRRAADAASGRA